MKVPRYRARYGRESGRYEPEEARNAAVEAVFALNRDVGIPPHLRDVGVRKEDIPALAQAALDDVCTGGNPREATLEDIVELYHTAW